MSNHSNKERVNTTPREKSSWFGVRTGWGRFTRLSSWTANLFYIKKLRLFWWGALRNTLCTVQLCAIRSFILLIFLSSYGWNDDVKWLSVTVKWNVCVTLNINHLVRATPALGLDDQLSPWFHRYHPFGTFGLCCCCIDDNDIRNYIISPPSLKAQHIIVVCASAESVCDINATLHFFTSSKATTAH